MRPALLTPCAAIRLSVLTACTLLVLSASGCREKPNSDLREKSAPLVTTSTHGPVSVTISAEPGEVTLDTDVLMRITISAPAGMEVTLPELESRVEGFSIQGRFSLEPETVDGRTEQETRVNLTPVISERFRIAPMAVRYRDQRSAPPIEGWFATQAAVFAFTPPAEPASEDMTPGFKPVWIRPAAKTIALWTAIAILGSGLLFLLWKLIHRVQEEVRVRRMSPRERALRELSQLLAKDLVRQKRVKEFYFELTMIVRRYIERQHAVRAPEQTTEEFLQAVSQDKRFTAEVIARLTAFLNAADLVKYAAHTPDDDSIKNALHSARDYIEGDTAAVQAEAAQGGV